MFSIRRIIDLRNTVKFYFCDKTHTTDEDLTLLSSEGSPTSALFILSVFLFSFKF